MDGNGLLAAVMGALWVLAILSSLFDYLWGVL